MRHLVYFIFFYTLSHTIQAKNCFSIAFSDTHISPKDLNKTHQLDNVEELLNKTAFYIGLAHMRETAMSALKGGYDCLNIIFNGDPFERASVGHLSAQELQREVESFAKVVKENFEDLVSEKELFLMANIGDHEIPKLRSIENIPQGTWVVESVVTGEQKVVHKTQMKEGYKRVTSLRDHYRWLIKNQFITFYEKKKVFRWKNGDDVLRLEEFSPLIMKGYQKAGWKVVPLPENKKVIHGIKVHDPRLVSPVIELPGGKRIQVAHIDNASNAGDLYFTYQQQIGQNQMVVERTEDGDFLLDERNAPRVKTSFNAEGMFRPRPGGSGRGNDILLLTSDGHLHRKSLALSLREPFIRSLIPGERVINTGSLSAVIKSAAHQMNGFVVFDPNMAEIVGMDLSGSGLDINGIEKSIEMRSRKPGALKSYLMKLSELDSQIEERKREGKSVTGLLKERARTRKKFEEMALKLVLLYENSKAVEYHPARLVKESKDFIEELEKIGRRNKIEALEKLRQLGIVPKDPFDHITSLLPCKP